ncbi:MAG: ATPase, T2SS/T4P/T4SS family [Candidatus Micrarchaeaceae archaeon]|jgi:flagellar protein FlaI
MAEYTQKILAEYNLDAHGTTVMIQIVESSDFVPLYNVTFPGIGDATKLLVMSLRSELTAMVPIDPARLEDKRYLTALNVKYLDAGNILIDKYVPGTSSETKKLLTSYIVNMMLGLGDLEALLADENLEEIAVNGAKDYIWVFHKELGWCKTNMKPASDNAIYDQASAIGRRIGREINNLSPLMDAELADGSRVNATLYPVSQGGNTITIRKFSKNPWTMTAMIKNGTLSIELASLVWLCIQNEISLLFSGGTASGKTSFLNACSMFFPATRRIISIEETRELQLPGFAQWIPMVSRDPNPEGKGEITLYRLMVNALRQRPDIMLIGEVRTEKDAETLFEAIHTGHSVYGTVHADNAQDTIVRMTNPPIAVPKITMNALGAIVCLFRHRTKGIRRVLELGEVLTTGDVNVLYKWNILNDKYSQISEMTRLLETFTLYGGLTKKDMAEDIAEKNTVLDWMVRNNITGIDDAGFVVANYYKHKDKVVQLVKDNVPFSRDIF